MAIRLKKTDYQHSTKIREMLKKDLIVIEKYDPFKYELKKVFVFLFDDDDANIVHLPMGYYYLYIYPLLPTLNPFPNDTATVHLSYDTIDDLVQLRPEQVDIYNSAMSVLDTKRCVLLGLHTGIGKTRLSIKMALQKKLATLCITNLTILKPQWEAEYNQCSSEHVAFIFEDGNQLKRDPPLYHPKSKKPIGLYIISPKLLEKAPMTYFDFIGTFLIDEFDLLCTPTFTPPLLRVHPKYIIGMTATPNNKRNELSANIIPLFVGNDWILKFNSAAFKVDLYLTDLVPVKEQNSRGKLDWNKVLNSIESKDDFNVHICSLVVGEFKDKNVLILLRSIRHMHRLVQLLTALKVAVDYVFGEKKKYDKEARVLVGIQRCLGTGFSDVKFQVCIIAFSEKLVEQYKGRIRTSYPLIVDYCHDRNSKQNAYMTHSNQRCEWYESRHGVIEKYAINLNDSSLSVWKQLVGNDDATIPPPPQKNNDVVDDEDVEDEDVEDEDVHVEATKDL
jgi:hypothetical protein